MITFVSKLAGLSSHNCQSLSYCHKFADDTISNCITLLLKCWLWLWGIIDNQHDTSINICGPRYQDIHHPQHVSTPTFMATNSAPNSDVSMVNYILEYKLINAIFKSIMYPILSHLVHSLPAWLLSINIHRSTSFPFGSREVGGIGSTAPSYKFI